MKPLQFSVRLQSPQRNYGWLFVLGAGLLWLAVVSQPAQAQTPSPTPTATLLPGEAAVSLVMPTGQPSLTLTIECPLPGLNGWCRAPVTVAMIGIANGSPIGVLSYLYDAQSFTQHEAIYSFVEGRGGWHSISSVTATDLLGRVTAPQAGEFKIDGAPPVAYFTGVSLTGLGVSITDAESGVADWTVQVFDANGQSVFYQSGRGAFTGDLSATLWPGNYYVEIFASDVAGHASHLARTAFQVAVFNAPTATVTATSQMYLVVAQATATSLPATQAVTAETISIATAAPSNASPTAPVGQVFTTFESAQVTSKIAQPSPFLFLLLVTVLGFLLVLLATYSLDRRASAIRLLADDLNLVYQRRQQLGGD